MNILYLRVKPYINAFLSLCRELIFAFIKNKNLKTMASYLKTEEIKTALRLLVNQYIEECKTCEEIPQDFIDLLRHNFLAKYVFYNKANKTIEIGVNEGSSPSGYPNIKVFSFPVNKAPEWLDKSFKNEKNDLEFYGKLLNRNKIISSSELVLI